MKGCPNCSAASSLSGLWRSTRATEYKFQLVMSGTEEGQTTRFYIREAEFYDNSELLMLTYGAKETVVVNIYGKFDLKQVARLSTIRPKK